MKPEPNQAQTLHRITPHALLETKVLRDLQLHPDGLRVAFTLSENDFEESRSVTHLWITEYVPPQDGEQPETPKEPEDWTRQLTYSREGESAPRWSPDGTTLAFLSTRHDPTEKESEEGEPTLQIWLLPMDGGEAKKRTSSPEPILDYCWIPDSSALLYLTPEPRPKPVESRRKEEQEHLYIDPTLEHDAPQRRQLWRIGADDEKPELLCVLPKGVEEFALAPSGKYIAYSTNYTGQVDDEQQIDLYVSLLEPASPSFKLIQRKGHKHSLRWSSEGALLAFVAPQDPDIPFSRDALFTVAIPSEWESLEVPSLSEESEGIATATLLPQPDYDVKDYEWQGGTQSLYALLANGLDTDLFRLSHDKAPEKIEVGEGDRSALAVSPDGNVLAWVRDTHTALSEVERWETGRLIQTLTHIHEDFGKTYRIPRHEAIRWTAPDGLEIEGVLIYPLDYREGETYPLVVQVHGGPKSHVVRALRNYYHSTVWASEGYAVLLPNFRGSDGYGNAFAVANYQDIGGGDFSDIMAGVDHCITLGLADPERLGIMGGSYGGFMTNWAIGHTKRFRAAISMFGIFNLQTDYANSDFPRWDHFYLGGWYWEVPELYQRLSPGTYVQNIQTPTLIVHGDEDNNTFISNSKEMYQALRHRGVTVQFVHYPREGHGVREPNHKMDEVRRSLAWMDRYLKSQGAERTRYRLRDAVPHPTEALELSVLSCEQGHYVGTPPVEKENPTSLWEIEFTVHRKENTKANPALHFALSEVRLLSTEETSVTLIPAGVPLKAHGGKILLEGENLHFSISPNPKTGECAFGCCVVVRVPQRGGEYLLHIADFPPVALAFGGKEEEGEER